MTKGEFVGLTSEAKERLIGEYIERFTTRTAEEQTCVTEVLLRDLSSKDPLTAYAAIAALTGGIVSGEQVLTLTVMPSRSHLGEARELAVAAATMLYGLYTAVTELEASGKTVNTSEVFGWLKDLVARLHEEKGLLDSLATYRSRVITILEDLAKPV